MSTFDKRCRQLNIQDFFTPLKRSKIEGNILSSTSIKMGDHNSEAQETSIMEENEAVEVAVVFKNSMNGDESGTTATITKDTDNERNSLLVEADGVLDITEENSCKGDSSAFADDGAGQSDQLSDLLNESDELFADLFDSEEDLSVVPVPSEKKDKALLKLNHWPNCKKALPPLVPNEKHTIMFRPHILAGCSPRPYPDVYRDRWDSDHVRMPCSPLNRYPVGNANGERIIQSRWEIICNALNNNIRSSIDLENAIMQYNRQYLGRWDFRGLHTFLNHHLDPDHKMVFFEFILPGMIDLALNLPSICTKPIPLLKKQMDHSITFSQRQIACLLANAFFCTFPRRNHQSRFHTAKYGGEYASYPDINFNRLFIGTKNGISHRNCEKLKCLLNYFSNVVQEEPTGTVTFHRQSLRQFPNWSACTRNIGEVVICSKGLIEDEGQGMLQIDFANRFVGGGVLGQGCVQEEIRFVISPELLISRLFTECLGETEALIITGVQQFSKYKGYGDTFTFDGNFQDEMPRDTWGRRYTQIAAIDALRFTKPSEQFKMSLIKRELNKAYSGFYAADMDPENLPAIATGNWGCGAFRGSPYLKFLIQLMAASATNRAMLYLSFGDQKLQDELQKMYDFIQAEKLSIGDLWTFLEMYCKRTEELRPSLYDFIYSTKDFNSDLPTDTKIRETTAIAKPKDAFVWPVFT